MRTMLLLASTMLAALTMTIPAAHALHAEDVGKHDFVVSTAGHGGSSSSISNNNSWLVPAIGTAGLSSSGGAVLTTSGTATSGTAAGRTYQEEGSSSSSSNNNNSGVETAGSCTEDSEESPYIIGPHMYMLPAASSSGSSSSANANANANACYLSSRSVETGRLLWRRNVCSSSSSSSSSSPSSTSSPEPMSHMYASSFSPGVGMVHTLDGSGTLRGWDDETGSLVFDVQVAGAGAGASAGSAQHEEILVGPPKLFGTSKGMLGIVGAVLPSSSASSASSASAPNDEVLALFDARTGKASGLHAEDNLHRHRHHHQHHHHHMLSAQQLLSEAKVKTKAGGGEWHCQWRQQQSGGQGIGHDDQRIDPCGIRHCSLS